MKKRIIVRLEGGGKTGEVEIRFHTILRVLQFSCYEILWEEHNFRF